MWIFGGLLSGNVRHMTWNLFPRFSAMIIALHYSTLLLTFSLADSSQSVEYVLEGKDVTLKCRIRRPLTEGARLYWIGPVNGTIDNYAIDNVTFNNDYKVELDRSEGRYDLTINRATYDRNNGLFICRVKEEVTGYSIHSSSVNLTVLIKPGSPKITPLHPTVIQGDTIKLTCSSHGGSPDPEIFWYRRNNRTRLESVLKPGGGRDFPTTSVLTLRPTRKDDGSEFLCEVRNRALSSHEKMVSAVTLNVNYNPIVRITPSNPVRVIEGEDVSLTCDVDAKPMVQNVRWMRGGDFRQTTKTLSLKQVSLDDAGRYICQADNNLGHPGEAEVTLDVLYPPSVFVPAQRDVSAGQNIRVACNVTSNPQPDSIYWTKEGDNTFHEERQDLQLRDVSSSDHGNYVCHAITVLIPSGSERIVLQGNATVSIRVRHAPGQSFILPSQPVAVEGEQTVLTCGANPPGYPETRYRWWREDTLMEIGENYTIPITTRQNEGAYYCQPFNPMGNGSVISARLRVFQAPRITEGLKPTAVYRRERTDLRLSCRAQGKPKPVTKWYKDGVELKEVDGLYTLQVNATEELVSEAGFMIQSTLSFRGPERIGRKALRPEDRGLYSCSFENEAAKVNSSQLLQIQHPPSLAHKISHVAYDVGEDAKLVCRMRAFPKPTFEWTHKNNVLQGISRSGRYAVNNTDVGDDVYMSVLTIRGVNEGDYGAYTCKAMNKEGPSKTKLFLQEKGLPSPPENIAITDSGLDFLELSFDPVFDGGYPNQTTYSARVSSSHHGEERAVRCNFQLKCIIRDLRQNTEYRIFLYAINPRGQSTLSASIVARTTLDPTAIPAPTEVFVVSGSGVVGFSVPEEVLQGSGTGLQGRLEVQYENGLHWTQVPAEIDIMNKAARMYDLGPIEADTRVRVRLCTENSVEICGPFQMAKRVNEMPQHMQAANSVNNLVIIIVVVVVVAVAVVALILVCCCCRQQRNTKLKKKTADMEVSHRGVVTQQAPPPPYYTVGLENKGMDGSIDRLNDHSKSLIYTTQQSYQNYSQNQPNPNGIGVGYMDNSYSNSNNGGSVNSQDSLWQVKGQQQQQQQPPLQHSDPNQMPQQHQMDLSGDHRNGYQYNPMVHGGYGITGYDDYAHYPPMSHHEQDYSRNAYNVNSDPYGVHKPQGMDAVDDSYDVNSMPNPYLDHHHNPNLQGVPQMSPQDTKPQISFDESLESGFSTPNSRNRRIIREIIV